MMSIGADQVPVLAKAFSPREASAELSNLMSLGRPGAMGSSLARTGPLHTFIKSQIVGGCLASVGIRLVPANRLALVEVYHMANARWGMGRFSPPLTGFGKGSTTEHSW